MAVGGRNATQQHTAANRRTRCSRPIRWIFGRHQHCGERRMGSKTQILGLPTTQPRISTRNARTRVRHGRATKFIGRGHGRTTNIGVRCVGTTPRIPSQGIATQISNAMHIVLPRSNRIRRRVYRRTRRNTLSTKSTRQRFVCIQMSPARFQRICRQRNCFSEPVWNLCYSRSRWNCQVRTSHWNPVVIVFLGLLLLLCFWFLNGLMEIECSFDFGLFVWKQFLG